MVSTHVVTTHKCFNQTSGIHLRLSDQNCAVFSAFSLIARYNCHLCLARKTEHFDFDGKLTNKINSSGSLKLFYLLLREELRTRSTQTLSSADKERICTVELKKVKTP